MREYLQIWSTRHYQNNSSADFKYEFTGQNSEDGNAINVIIKNQRELFCPLKIHYQ